MMAEYLAQTSIKITHTHTQAVHRATPWLYFVNRIVYWS